MDVDGKDRLMPTLDELLTDLRERTDARTAPLQAARERVAVVRAAAEGFHGALRTYRSGSLETHLFNDPVTDGDGGLVLDRVKYRQLGPDGDGALPQDVVDELCAYLSPRVRHHYPDAQVHRSKRGPKVYFGEPVEGQQPYVDLVVALTRAHGQGVWIPNLARNRWEASHPERHVALLNGGAVDFRRTRRRVTRLVKAWNGQYVTPGASSFLLAVWGLEFVSPGLGIGRGLWTVFDSAAARLESGESTADPAGVSRKLGVLPGVTEQAMATRLRTAATAMRSALDSRDEDAAAAAIGTVFYRYFDQPGSSPLKAAIGSLATGLPVAASTLGIAAAASTRPQRRSYGGAR